MTSNLITLTARRALAREPRGKTIGQTNEHGLGFGLDHMERPRPAERPAASAIAQAKENGRAQNHAQIRKLASMTPTGKECARPPIANRRA